MGSKKSSRDRIAPKTVARVVVEKLFGHYTYNLQPSKGTLHSVSRLALLYGDNGSGKTTIAQLMFHLLSPGDERGHRTFLGTTRFKRFSVHFGDGTSISAERPGARLQGPYRIVSRKRNRKKLEVHVKTQEDGSVISGGVDEAQLVRLFKSLSIPPFTVYFLSDNRVLQSDAFEPDDHADWAHPQGVTLRSRLGDPTEQVLVPSRTRSLSVEPSIERAESWMRRHTLNASTAGEASTSAIYTDILKRIARTVEIKKSKQRNLKSLLKALLSLAERSKSSVELELTSPVPFQELQKIISGASRTQSSLLASVLEPYVDSIQARLNALERLQRLLITFRSAINAFYKLKSVRLSVREGIQVYDQSNDRLNPELLSSGEKQLLLLLCNILVSTDRPSLFIIDEPELSLNVKWQRELVDALLDLVQDSQVQFIMATHSIELLTRHKASVLRLDSLTHHDRA